MNATEVTTIVSSLGFPIFMALAMGWFVKYLFDTMNKELAHMREAHSEEVAQMTEAINNNTTALQLMLQKLEDMGNEK